ncbi:MAG: hypothetical protein M1823_006028 [Watsoniomyces obsoletus]|nr:MAG: hypothetical protein M1823_006028 [Watsoniomyces obsoletus]
MIPCRLATAILLLPLAALLACTAAASPDEPFTSGPDPTGTETSLLRPEGSTKHLSAPEICVRRKGYRRQKIIPGKNVVDDPTFRSPYNIPSKKNPGGLGVQYEGQGFGPHTLGPNGKFALKEELDAFWQGYRLFMDPSDTSTWTPEARKVCMDAFRDGRRAAPSVPLDRSKRWRFGFSWGWKGVSVDPSHLGNQAGKLARQAFQGSEVEARAYSLCFQVGMTAEHEAQEAKSPKVAEGILRGYEHGIRIGECTANLRKQVGESQAQETMPNPDLNVPDAALGPYEAGPTMGELGDWLLSCVEEARRARRSTERRVKVGPIKSAVGRWTPFGRKTGEEVVEAGNQAAKDFSNSVINAIRNPPPIPPIKFSPPKVPSKIMPVR